MDKDDSAFYDKLLSSFKLEADEHLKVLSSGLLKLEKEDGKEEFSHVLQEMFRAAHSLKGASRAVNILPVETLCQSVEDVFAFLKKNPKILSGELIDTVYDCIDAIDKILKHDNASDDSVDSEAHSKLIDKLDRLMQKKAQSLPDERSPTTPPPTEKAKPLQPKPATGTSPPLPTQAPPRVAGDAKKIRNENEQTIRTSSTKIDKLLQHVEEMLIIKQTSQQRIKELNELEAVFAKERKIRPMAELQKSLITLMSAKSDYIQQNLYSNVSRTIEGERNFRKKIKQALTRLRRLCEQDHRMICSMVDGVLDDTKEIVMHPFSTLTEGFPRMVRDLSKSLSKEAELVLEGTDIEIDRRILEKLKDPLMHALRNCVDHGIEYKEVRKERGKSPKGHIRLAASQVSGNTVEITVTDDGQGLNIDKIKDTGIKKGIISPSEAAELSEKEAVSLICQAGFSTSPIVSEISGRGLGMNVLAENVEKLGGQFSIESKPYQGTTIKLLLPLTLATFRGIHIKVNDQDYMMPTHHVRRVLRARAEQIKRVENRRIFTYQGKTLSFVHLSDLLGIPHSEDNTDKDLFHILIIKAGESSAAIAVDAILNEQEVFVKGLGQQLKKVPCITAATVMEWGKVTPILDPFDMIKSVSESNHGASASTAESKKKTLQEKKTILVVEDSVTSRMLLKNILESAGYHVETAVDGVEALTHLNNEKVDLLLTDIEMPRMDGFELTEKVRSTDHLHDLPVILCTSLGSREDRERGIQVKANAYLDKSSFVQSKLLSIIGQLL